MKFVSTRGEAPELTASEAILKGLAPDGGLYVPEELPELGAEALNAGLPYHELAARVLAPFFEEDELRDELPGLCRSAFSFPVELVPLNSREMRNDGSRKRILELFHGPTAAFKDFGARFLAAVMERLQEGQEELIILVATSGDTGGAVASAFYGRKNLSVRVLFPEGRVSDRQQKQLTCWGGNVSSYAVRGAFDDCQRVVKQAFVSADIARTHRLSSANSINLGRLLPQAVYYVWASLQYERETGEKPVVIVPSGNVGNSVGAYYARAMGAPIERIVLAVNANRVIPDFIESGEYTPRPSIRTLANAMDVGDPSNMERLRWLFPDMESFRSNVEAHSVPDEQIREMIGRLHREYGYVPCPHTASGEWVRHHLYPRDPTIVVATAHPAKFDTIVEPLIGEEVPPPTPLLELLEAGSQYETIDAHVKSLFPDVFD
jgi:threonine synthase